MRIPQSVIDEIYRVADIVEVIGDYLPLKKRGQNFWGLSPFKAERTPSFSVSPAKQIFKDFSSGKGGGVVTFLMELEGYTYPEALRQLAQKYGIALELEDSSPEPDRRASLQALANWGQRWFEEQLHATPEGQTVGLSYLRERGFNPETIRAFGLGYSPEKWDALTQAAARAQFNPAYLTELGLSLVKEDTNARYDRFRGRVIFPLFDARGQAVGFAGRILKADARAAKYVNSPESELYHKSQLLYGLHLAKQAIRAENQAILVEGYTDLISLYQAGVRNVVASSGTALTQEQLVLLKRYTAQLVVVYDGDSAGTAATLRALEMALGAGFNVKALHLPEADDPDSFVRREGGSAFRSYLAENGQDFVRYLITHSPALPGENPPERTTRLAHAASQLLAQLPDPLSRSNYVRYAAAELGIPEATFLPVVNQAVAAAHRQAARNLRRDTGEATDEAPTIQTPAEDGQPPEEGAAGSYAQERELLRLLVAHGLRERVWNGTHSATIPTPLIEFLREELDEVDFRHPLHETFRQKIFAAYAASGTLPHPERWAEPGTPLAQLVAELLAEPHTLSENWAKQQVWVPLPDADLEAAVASALVYFRARRIKQLFAESLESIRSAPPQELDRLLKRHQRLQKVYTEVFGQIGSVVPG